MANEQKPQGNGGETAKPATNQGQPKPPSPKETVNLRNIRGTGQKRDIK